MIKITDKSKCCGCEACVQVCPKHSISFSQDNEGFFYPVVDIGTCIQCGLCEKVCPVLLPYDEHKPQEVLAAINKDEKVRMVSSSGGVFILLAKYVISQGGVVFGVRFDNQWQAIFDYAESIEALNAFKGSKYVQARVNNCFVLCKQFLDKGRQVLFSGTQCQIAGLLHFLRKPYQNLLTVDVVCHGVPSPRVWQCYLQETVPGGRQAIKDIQFRDKRLGWKRFSLTVLLNEQQHNNLLSSPFNENPFMRAFVKNLILRPSCYSCPAKLGKSSSDITLADFWGVEKVEPAMFDNRGTSLVLVNTEKGGQALNRNYLKFTPTKFEYAVKFNPQAIYPAICHPNRNLFFESFNEHSNILSLIDRCLRPPLLQRLKSRITGWYCRCQHILRLLLRKYFRDTKTYRR
jgi:coenzyme F420-reducing hydrogenase beta subunit